MSNVSAATIPKGAPMGLPIRGIRAVVTDGADAGKTVAAEETLSIGTADGNSIETQIDNFATVEEIDEWFRGGAFEENAIGVVFDPDELVRRHEAGVPFRVLVERPSLPEGKTPFDMLRF